MTCCGYIGKNIGINSDMREWIKFRFYVRKVKFKEETIEEKTLKTEKSSYCLHRFRKGFLQHTETEGIEWF